MLNKYDLSMAHYIITIKNPIITCSYYDHMSCSLLSTNAVYEDSSKVGIPEKKKHKNKSSEYRDEGNDDVFFKKRLA